jgi:peptidoglycan/LPS O-acetylase OafA/YrhL
MLGMLRFLLAYLVVLSHLVGSEYMSHFGFYAVRGFFVISGFIMTLTLNETYAFDGARFWANRALRLLPPFYLVSLATLAAVFILPQQAADFLKFWRVPSLGDILLNLSVLPLQLPGASFRMVPPFWSVAVEIDMYVLLYFVIARRMEWAVFALVAGIAYQLACSFTGLNWDALYFFGPSAVLPFAVGALIYFLGKNELWTVTPQVAAVAFVAWLANMLAGGSIFSDSYVSGAGYYLDTVFFTLVVAGLVGRRFGPLVRRIDTALGEWAYFAFLVQWLAAFVVAVAFLDGEWRGWTLMLATTPVIVVLSAGLAALNRKLLEPLRDRVRNWHTLRADAAAELNALLHALGLDPGAAAARDPARMGALRRSCAGCALKQRCRDDVAGSAAGSFRAYCPNAVVIEGLAAAR